MKDRYFLKKEKVANLLFDLVKYLLTALGAVMLFSEKSITLEKVFIISVIAISALIMAIFITPAKED